MPETIFIGEDSQYFFDNRMIKTGKLMTRKYHSPEKYTASRQLIKKTGNGR